MTPPDVGIATRFPARLLWLHKVSLVMSCWRPLATTRDGHLAYSSSMHHIRRMTGHKLLVARHA